MKRKFKDGKYSSNASIFARRGDPWVSRKEGEKNFHRNVETENPDFDRYFSAKAPKEREPLVEPKPEPKRDYQREKHNIYMRMKNRTAPKAQVIEAHVKTTTFHPCPGCRKAICIAKSICLK